MKRTAYFSIVLFLSVMVSSCTEINETERAPTVERKIVETQASGKIVSRVTPIPSKPTNQTPRETSRVLPDHSGLNDPQVEEQFLSFRTQLDYLTSNPKSVDDWIDMISLDSNSLFLPELPDCRGSKVRKCFDELMPAVERAKLDADYMPGSLVKEIPGSDACIIMNYTYGIVKIYGEPQSDEHPEINSNFETMVRYNFIGTSTTSNESELSNFRWAFRHRNDWDYLVHCVKVRETSRVLPDHSGLNDPQVEEQFLSFRTQLDYLTSNPKSVDDWIDMISLDRNSLFLPELPDCRGSKVRKCFDELMPLVERYDHIDFGANYSSAMEIPYSDACNIMNYAYGIVKIYGEPQSDEHPEINSNFKTMVRFNFINEDELVNFRWAFHHRNHWDYLVHCVKLSETSRVLPDYSGLNDPQVEEQFLSFRAQLDYLTSNPKSVDDWIDMISLDSNSLFLPELPDCRGSKVRKCFDELMPLVERYQFGPGGTFATRIPPSDACDIMNYAYGIVKIYGEPQSDEHPEINSNFKTMVRFNFINEDELVNFRGAFHHRNHWDYLEYCL